jgi:hypothetical protein
MGAKLSWVVRLTKPIPALRNDFPAGYFPRKHYYRADAVRQALIVHRRGGEAVVEKEQR